VRDLVRERDEDLRFEELFWLKPSVLDDNKNVMSDNVLSTTRSLHDTNLMKKYYK